MVLEIGKYYRVKVVDFRTSGAIVELEDGSNTLIHVSRISTKFVKNPEDWLNKDETYVAIGVEGRARPVELSLTYLELKPKARAVNNARSNGAHKDITPKQQKLPSTSSPEVYQSTLQGSDSLEAMIQKANKALQDKVTAKHSRYNQADRMKRRHK